jgi:HSP20 family protein
MDEALFAPWDEDTERPAALWSPRMDLVETDGAYQVQMDLPGLTTDDVSIDVDDHHLVIHGRRAEETRTGKAGTGKAGTGKAGTGEAGTGEAGTGEAGKGEAGEEKTDGEKAGEEEARVLRLERHYGHFYRSLTLPDAARPEQAEATFRDGVLTVRIPKAEAKTPKTIRITS